MSNKQNEQNLVRQPCVELMKQYKALNVFRGWKYFQCVLPQDLGKLTEFQKVRAKKNGYEAGVLDMYILAADSTDCYIWIVEFKYGDNDLSDIQEEVRESTVNTPVRFLTIYDPQVFGDFIEAEVMRL